MQSESEPSALHQARNGGTKHGRDTATQNAHDDVLCRARHDDEKDNDAHGTHAESSRRISSRAGSDTDMTSPSADAFTASGTKSLSRYNRYHPRYLHPSRGRNKTPISTLPLRVLYHYPSSLPFPTFLSADFPSEAYRSRGSEVKCAVHWGQRKLLLSEIQLLSMYCRPAVSYHVVYAGSAPGTHIAFLDAMFGCVHTWELIDPGQFDRAVLECRPNVALRNEFFTNATAYGITQRRLRSVCPAFGELYSHLTAAASAACSITAEHNTSNVYARLQKIVGTLDVARGTEDIPCMYEPPVMIPVGLELLMHVALERCTPLLFVSDVRSGSVALPNFEEHVAENMRAQAVWTRVLQGEYSILKFRLPYTTLWSRPGSAPMIPNQRQEQSQMAQQTQTHLIDADGTVPYLRGDILLPIWTRPTSTEGRLVVPRALCGLYKRYDVAKIENQFFFFNARVREQIHFNHILRAHSVLDHSYDAAAEVNCLATYLLFVKPHLRQDASALCSEVDQLSSRITEELGRTFEDCISRRHRHSVQQLCKLEVAQSAAEGDYSKDSSENTQNGGDAKRGNASWMSALHELSRQAAVERKRAVMWRNVDETADSSPDVSGRGIWVTTTIKEQ